MRKQGEAFDNEFPDSGLGMNSLQYNKIKPFISSSTKSVLEAACEEMASLHQRKGDDTWSKHNYEMTVADKHREAYNKGVDAAIALLRESAE